MLKNTFESFSLGDHNFDCLINFDLIRKNKPFPWAKARKYDAIVFSPIQHADYRTELLKEFCEKHGIKYISYPWMQWNGYFPEAKKGEFLGGVSWMYPVLYDKKKNNFKNKYFIENLRHSDKLIQDFEIKHEVDIRISNFIENNFRNKRLFLTPDHPTAFMYRYLVNEVADKLSINMDMSYWLSAYEPQGGIKLPIRPGVAEALDLDFVDADFENCTAFGDLTMPWSAYLQLYDMKDGVILEAKSTTIIKDRAVTRTELASTEFTVVSPGDIIIFSTDGMPSIDGHVFGKSLLAKRSKYAKFSNYKGYLFINHWIEKKIGLI
ncbi:hypothetical protein [Sphingobium terrigena]|uniref:hypothetical protein n=1 Tax=Sphingobium terrigena TaxID=2304063 RepID=UPI001600E1B9|nr:hypothetical protein [Sphingobium terrigena]